MDYRDILVHLDTEPVSAAGERRRAYAISLADALASHLTGLVLLLEPYVHPAIMGEIPADFLEVQRREMATAARKAADAFTQSSRTAGIQYEPRIVQASEGPAPSRLASHGSVADLIVVGQSDPSEGPGISDRLIEAALFESGRPTLVVPYVGHDTARFERVIVAWDGGRQAARAAHDALPFLIRAKKVEIVVIGDRTPAARSEEPGADLGLHLARHGADVDVKQIAGGGGIDEANLLLSHSADYGADLLVMGGYAHARFRQLIFGGMTRSILQSMTLPVLMSH
jgi:nucleotide-binding universal stress UspA family protein